MCLRHLVAAGEEVAVFLGGQGELGACGCWTTKSGCVVLSHEKLSGFEEFCGW